MRYTGWLLTLISLILAWWLNLDLLCQNLENNRLTQRISNSHQQTVDPSIVILGIDDEVFTSNRFNRLEHARVIDQLTQAGAKAIFLDLILDEARGPQLDIPLAQAISQSGIVTVAGNYQDDPTNQSPYIFRPRFYPELQTVAEQRQCQIGIINTSHQAVKSETILAIVDNCKDPAINPYKPGLQLSAATALFAQSQHLNAGDGETILTDDKSKARLNLGYLHLETTVNTQQDLNLLMIPISFHLPATGPNAQPGAPGRLPVIPYLKIADADRQALQAVSNKIVLIGDNRKADIDLYNTPVGKMKGVEIHAQALNTLLGNNIPVYISPESSFFKQTLLGILVLCLFYNYLLERQPDLWRCFLVTVATLTLWELIISFFDQRQVYLPQTLGEAALLITFSVSMLVRLQATRSILRTFIPAAIADQLLRGEQIQQGTVQATVMVTDIRGYTTLSESRTPTQVLDLLNDYHTETVTLYQKFGGHVLNYQGDAQIILFGHPKPLKDAPRQAILAAQAASGAVEILRKRWKLPADQAFNVGAGICTGKVIIADLGGQHREYTVIGELVRKCHKLQSQSQVLKANIILDEETYERCIVKPQVEKRENITIEGLPEPLTVYITDLVS